MITLIKTKLFIPRPRADLVSRPRLIDQLDEGARRKLTLVSAPAGFGKTSLIADWAREIAFRAVGAEVPKLAWVSLDGGDNDVGRFFAYFIVALQTIEPQLGTSLLTALQSPQPPEVNEFLPTLINELSSLVSETVLVLDDYHVIDNDEIHQAMTFLLEHAPASFHLFLAVRHDPPFSLLPRLRVRMQLTSLRAGDLRFTSGEAAHFLNEGMGLQLAAEQIASLEERTEGWIAGLQLAALSMRGYTPSQKSDFINTLSGSHQYLVDYLAEEILNQQAPAVQRFLQETAILSRLSAPLCDAVTGRTDSQQLLERLASDNLFVIALDDERHWYRYHRLFAGFLQNQPTDEDPQAVRLRHTRAAGWFAAHDFRVEAIEHALAGQDYKLAIGQITVVAMTMMAGGEYKTLLRWLEALPDEEVRQRADLALPYAYVLSRLGEWEQVASYLEAAERSLSIDTPPLHPSLRKFARGTIHFIRSVVFLGQGDLIQATRQAEQALSELPARETVVRQLIISQLGTIKQLQGDWAAARQWFTRLAAMSEHTLDVKAKLMLLNNKAGAEATQGYWHAAARHYRQALQLAQTHRLGHLPLVGAVHIGLGQVLLTWFDLEAAESELQTGIPLVQQTGMAGAWLTGVITLAHVKQWQEDDVAAERWLKQAVAIVAGVNIPQIDALFAALEARFYLKQGAQRKALSWLRASRLQPAGELVHLHMTEYLVVARLIAVQAQHSEALALLAKIQAAAQAAEQMPIQIEATILQALSHETLGERKNALGALRQALQLAEPEGYITQFVEGGAAMATLLQTLRQTRLPGFLPDYVDELSDVLRSRFELTPEPDAEKQLAPDVVPLLDPLTEREAEILALIAQGYGNKAVAKELFVAVSTVRTHLKNLYSKLDARSRTHAIARARELNLLD
ncbi:MAG: LuxR C-terminal-related transcriptional regulator [Ardenticatenaceae bacterium]